MGFVLNIPISMRQTQQSIHTHPEIQDQEKKQTGTLWLPFICISWHISHSSDILSVIFFLSLKSEVFSL